MVTKLDFCAISYLLRHIRQFISAIAQIQSGRSEKSKLANFVMSSLVFGTGSEYPFDFEFGAGLKRVPGRHPDR
jgi:hypothetical protein